MKTVYSAGVIPFVRREEKIEFLVIKHLFGRHWSFPKGGVEEGETTREAALRELAEETGLEDVDLKEYFLENDEYTFWTWRGKCQKKVSYFLGEVRNDELTLQRTEIKKARWLNLEDALDTLTHDGSKRILKSAYEHITE